MMVGRPRVPQVYIDEMETPQNRLDQSMLALPHHTASGHELGEGTLFCAAKKALPGRTLTQPQPQIQPQPQLSGCAVSCILI